MRHCFFLFFFVLFVPLVVHADPGLQDDPEKERPKRETPALPEGLGDAPSQGDEEDEDGSSIGPALPPGLGGEERSLEEAERHDDGRSPRADFVAGFTGFWDTRAGIRVRDDPNQRTTSLGESRLQLSRDQYSGDMLLRVTADLLYDHVADGHEVQPEQGRGWLDLRETYLAIPVGDAMDLRIGRQVLTWGVGDLLFLNDLFPKDWNSFFAGRDVEYLKAPSDALRAAFFSNAVNLDVVYTPKFDPDRFLDNRRLSFFDPRIGRVAGQDITFRPVRPGDWFSDDEWAFRLHRIVNGWEVAAYGYLGFWKSPEGFDPGSGRPLFPELAAWGGSLRGPLGPGILTAETSWYRSLDDLSGADPFLPNSQFRILAGYEQELVPDFMLGGQYYLERTLDHDALLTNQPRGVPTPAEDRHLFTLRATLLTHSHNVTWSLFTFASPSEDDAYIRGSWAWKITDGWTVSTGFNVFEGRRESSFFGQFERNTNSWASLRYGF